MLAWEKGELFPTKQYIDKMEALRAKGPGAIPRKSKGDNPVKALADPLAGSFCERSRRTRSSATR